MDNENRRQDRDRCAEDAERTVETDLFERFIRLQWLFHRHHMHNHRRHGPMGDPHRGQGRVLRLLSMRPEISQKDLTYLLDMRPQSLGELLAKLERGGYITREPSAEDRRVVNIKLTEQGKKAAEEFEPDAGSDELFACLTEEEQSALNDYLGRIIEALEAKMEDGGESFGFGFHGRGPEGFDGHGVFGMGRGHGRRDGCERDHRFAPPHSKRRGPEGRKD